MTAFQDSLKKKTGTEKVIGLECSVYEMNELGAQVKIWLWKNIVLKKITKNDQSEDVKEAIEFVETADFPVGIFDVPSDVTFKVPETQYEDDDD